VIVIIGMLLALVGPQLMGAADDAKVTTARAQISNLKNALDMYKLKIGKYPTTAEGLSALISNSAGRNFLDQDNLPKDPWDNDFEYTCPGTKGHDFEIVCYGADGAPGGSGEYDADIVSWNLSGAE